MKYILPLCLLIVLNGCGEPNDEPMFEEDPIIEEVFSEGSLIRNIESKLSIPANEKYTYKIYEAHLNADDSLDFIVTINQLDKAINEAIASGNVAKFAEVGYMGNYNHLFYVDGATKEISSPIAIASSPHAQLEINFEHIRTGAFKDVTVDFRIRNSCYRRFFSVINNHLAQTFETKIFDGLGSSNSEAFVIGFLPGTYSESRDIIVYKAEMESYTITDPQEVYGITPEITATPEIDRKWFFNDRELKYYTEKN